VAATGGRARNGAITGINVTPLVDITLVLLIIFMVTAKLIVGQKAITVDLPKAQTGDAVQEIFSVVLASPTGTQINGRSVLDDEAILAEASTAIRQTRDLRAVLQADGRVPHARVMHALDLLRQGGVAKVAFGVVPPESPKPIRESKAPAR
jgi:biopolymer transport protein ExbD